MTYSRIVLNVYFIIAKFANLMEIIEIQKIKYHFYVPTFKMKNIKEIKII